MFKLNVENPMKNQVSINIVGYGTYFVSYGKVIALIDTEGQVFLDKIYHDYSRTTRKWRNIFLRKTANEVKGKIMNGEYILKSLN